MKSGEDAETLLRRVGRDAANTIDIAGVALVLAGLDRPGVPLARYHDHLDLLAEDLRRASADAESIEARILAVREVLFAAYGYEGDRRTYDDLQNANLMRVIDRRRGLPVALGILCIHAARAQGWEIGGLAFPGHFLLRMDHLGQRAILDPFAKCAPQTASDLRALLKAQGDESAELRPEHHHAVSDRTVLVRLQNNIRLRQSRSGDQKAAARTLERMLWIAPDDKMMWREKALLDAQLGRIDTAVAALEEYISRETLDGPRHDAALLLQRLRGQSS
ncbi:MAG: transglutaminase family protein [Rhodospirillales bacterium]|nr:MAG: transglutaminase family protein [Rhodospirillales bacterium]